MVAVREYRDYRTTDKRSTELRHRIGDKPTVELALEDYERMAHRLLLDPVRPDADERAEATVAECRHCHSHGAMPHAYERKAEVNPRMGYERLVLYQCSACGRVVSV